MTGRFTLVTEVLQTLHQTASEESLPLTVDGHACSQRVFIAEEPFCERKSSSWGFLRQRREKRRDSRRDFFLGRKVLTTMVPVGHSRIVRWALLHDEGGLPAWLCLASGEQWSGFFLELGCRLQIARKERLTL